jgi:hypothetical protein
MSLKGGLVVQVWGDFQDLKKKFKKVLIKKKKKFKKLDFQKS